MRYLSILLAVLLVAAPAFAAPAGNPGAPEARNPIYRNGHGDVDDPIQEVVLVRFCTMVEQYDEAKIQDWILSGELVVWDTTSVDGVSVKKAPTSAGSSYATVGIAVTDMAPCSDDSVTQDGDWWGYVCVYGYALASIDHNCLQNVNLGASKNYPGALSADLAFTGASNDSIVTLQAGSKGTKVPVWIK